MNPAFQLHHQWVGDPAPDGAWLLLHGILGRGSNWMSFARKIVERRPGLGIALVDLRMHGESGGAPPPHDLESCVADLDALAGSLPAPVTGVCGHSFGSKVALAFAGNRGESRLQELWLFDGEPGPARSTTSVPVDAPPDQVDQVLAVLDAVPTFHASRADFVHAVEGRGLSRPVAQWLGSQARKSGLQWSFGLELTAIRALLDSYRQTNGWPILEALPAERTGIVLGGRSPVVGASSRDRLNALAADHPTRVSVQILENAGHWLHVDDLSGLVQAVDLPR